MSPYLQVCNSGDVHAYKILCLHAHVCFDFPQNIYIHLYQTYQVTPSFFKFLFIWFFLPTNSHPHPTLCHSVLYFVLYEFFVFILHIYSELPQEFYFICCTVLYLYCSAHIKLDQLRNSILAFTSFSRYFRMHLSC